MEKRSSIFIFGKVCSTCRLFGEHHQANGKVPLFTDGDDPCCGPTPYYHNISSSVFGNLHKKRLNLFWKAGDLTTLRQTIPEKTASVSSSESRVSPVVYLRWVFDEILSNPHFYYINSNVVAGSVSLATYMGKELWSYVGKSPRLSQSSLTTLQRTTSAWAVKAG